MTPVLRVIRNLCGLCTMFETLRPDANLRQDFLSGPRSRASVHRISSLTGTFVGRYGPSCIFLTAISFRVPPSLSFFHHSHHHPAIANLQTAPRIQLTPWRPYVHCRHTHDSKRPVVRLCHTHPVSMCNPSTWPAKPARPAPHIATSLGMYLVTNLDTNTSWCIGSLGLHGSSGPSRATPHDCN